MVMAFASELGGGPPAKNVDLLAESSVGHLKDDGDEGIRVSNDEEERKQSRISPRRSRLLIFMFGLAAALSAFLASQEWRNRRVPRSGGLPEVEGKAQPPWEDLRRSLHRLQTELRNSPRVVRDAFRRQYVPSLGTEELAEGDASKLYEKHVRAVEQLKRTNLHPKDYFSQVLLVTCVCDAATERIRELNRMLDLFKDTGMEIPLLGIPETRSLPSAAELDASSSQTTLESFSKRVSLSTEAPSFVKIKDGRRKVPKELADRLMLTVRQADLVLKNASSSVDAFQPWLKSVGLDLRTLHRENFSSPNVFRLLHDGSSFDMGSFLQILQRGPQAHCIRPHEIMGMASGSWTISGLLRILGNLRIRLEDDAYTMLESRRLEMSEARKSGVYENDSLFALAVYLL